MKYVANVVGALLGLLFVVSVTVYFLKLVPMPEFPEGSHLAMFNGALIGSGYMDFVKIVELLGGIFIALPRTRNIGLLFLGPVVINILAAHLFIMKDGLLNPVLLFVTFGTAFLLWTRREAFLKLIAS